jgi:hypothetical protein
MEKEARRNPAGSYIEPSDVEAEAGQVVVDGPGGVAYAMAPGAAGETADRLKRAARDAGQQVCDSRAASPRDDEPERPSPR